MEQPSDQKPELRVVPALPDRITDGRDELNFAEFPLGTIAERLDPDTKTLFFEDKIFDKSRNALVTRKLTITGSDAYGLPTSTDDEVLLGLIQLSKLQKFQNRQVYFSRYQLIKLLRWPVTGQSYERIDQALNRWIGVTLYYENAWRDKATNAWVDEKFHILERIKIYSLENERSRPKPTNAQGHFEFASSFFVWNEALFKSFNSGNLKALDYDFVIGLRSSISRRLYRFLDKRFWHSTTLEFELKNLAYEHIGLSRKTAIGGLKRKLSMAIDELVQKGFLKDLPAQERFTKLRVGIWNVKFVRGRPEPLPAGGAPDVEKPVTESVDENPLVAKLMKAGVLVDKARELAAKSPAQVIEEKIQVLNWLLQKKDRKVSLNPAGFLIRSIEKGYDAPKTFEPEEELKRKEAQKAKRAQQIIEREKRKKEQELKREAELREAINQFWQNISLESRNAFEAEALAQADRFQSELAQGTGSAAKAAMQNILDNYALSKLSEG